MITHAIITHHTHRASSHIIITSSHHHISHIIITSSSSLTSSSGVRPTVHTYEPIIDYVTRTLDADVIMELIEHMMHDEVMPNRRMLMAVVKYYFKRNDVPSMIAFVDDARCV